MADDSTQQPPEADSPEVLASESRVLQIGMRRWSWLLVVAILLFSAGNAYLGYDAQRALSSDYRVLQQVNSDLILLDRVLLLVVDAETGQRGYILTREPSYRQPYDAAILQLESAMDELFESLQAYPAVSLLYAPFAFAVNEKANELASTLSYAEANDFDAGRRITEENRGQELMENIRQTGNDISAALVAESEALESAISRKQNRTLLALGSAAVASVVLLLALVAVGRRDAIRKEQLNELLLDRNEELDAAVRERTHELQIANQQFDRSNRELENFAYVVSHDLQEPLRKIRAFGDRLIQSDDQNLSQRSREFISRMQSAALRMSTLLSDLLQFSRVNTRGLEYVDLNLNELVDTVLEDLELVIEEKSAQVTVDELPEVRGDLTQLRQLFQNIVSNGLKFQSDGNVPEISIDCVSLSLAEDQSPAVQIDIRDNGIGFDAKYLDRIFDPFQRLHGRAEFEGSGIGLAICRRVAERHGGSLSASSVPGKGSVFSLVLPLDAETAAERNIPVINREA